MSHSVTSNINVFIYFFGGLYDVNYDIFLSCMALPGFKAMDTLARNTNISLANVIGLFRECLSQDPWQDQTDLFNVIDEILQAEIRYSRQPDAKDMNSL